MTIRIAKGAVGAQPNRQAQPPTLQKPSKSARLKPIERPAAARTKSRAPVIAVAITASIGIILLLCLIPSQPPSRQTASTVTRGRPAQAEKPYVPRRPAELGGLTMAEWERKNNTNNVLLEGRKERMKNYGTGQ